VGASVLFGVACSGWLALVLGIMEIPLRVHDPQGSQELIAPFIRFGYLMPWMTYPLMSVAFAAAGLLQPLAFLQRYAGRFRRLHVPALVICAGLVSTMRIHTQSTAEFLVVSSVFVASLLVPFFELDLLASIVCVTTFFSVVSVAGGVASIPAFASRALVTHLAPLAILSVFALLSIRSGRVCVEEQVRPLYARHIAERKSIEAEVSAAREAQLRLLPETLPQFGSLDIAAVCVPAETVGGDFYDFFQLGDGRLGVFIAEGNNRGLAAALTIALAKGYLMHSVGRSSDPVEILTRLETALGAIFNANVWGNEDEGSAPLLTEFAFAAIDTAAGTIRYARTSVYPKVVIVSENGQAATERTVPVKGRATPIAEGWAAFRQGDHVLLFTDGVGRRLAAGNRRPDDVASLLAREAQQPDRIKHAVLDYSRATAEPDDLTLIVIRATAEAALDRSGALGVVA
jgi:serine phosphatase RsbU (regulator of sigma subunit)